MSSSPNQPSCDNPFRGCLKWMDPNSPSSPTSPSDRLIQNPSQPRNISQEPTSTTAMTLIRVPSNLQPVAKSAAGHSDGWRAFGDALKTLEAAVGIFPPLKAAVSELLACATHIQIAEQNRQEYDQLSSDLVGLVQTLQTHLPESKPRWMPYSIENVARSIGEQAAHIKRQQDRLGLAQVVRAADDEVNILGCYRRIEHIFRRLQADISLSIWDLTHEQWVNTALKDLNPVHDARYNAALSMDMQRRGCTPDTRVNILKEVIEWTRDPDAAKIYWMNGMAGTGKTTVAYSLCEQLEQSKQLGACFFCSRPSPACRNANNIMPTIAYQLALFSNPYRNKLCEVLANKPDIAKREISIQFSELIVKPLLGVEDAIPADLIVVIDGLDECSGERDQELVFDRQGTQKILDLMVGSAFTLPVKFFVTSRPEPGISKKFDASNDTQRFVLHDVEESFVQEDIGAYLRHELRGIKADPKDVERLTERAGRLFIFAATALRYIDPDNDNLDHCKRLTVLLGARSGTKGRAYQELDELYSGILRQALMDAEADERDIRRLVLHTVVSAREPLTISALTEITGLPSEQSVRLALQPFQSVLRASSDTKVVSTLHASFSDFMLSAERSKELHCNPNKQNAYMAERCFLIMEGSLKFNICGFQTSSQRDQDISGLDARVKETISSQLFYACRYWGDHLYGTDHSKQLEDMLDEFLRCRLLYWMEVLNLNDCMGSSGAILLQAFKFLPLQDTADELHAMIQDARNFTTTYSTSPASDSTPHIYISALSIAPKDNFIRKAYWPRMSDFAWIEGTAVKDPGNVALATWSAGAGISKLLLSKDGKRLASGTIGGAIAVWDVMNGRRLLGPLEKHEDVVYALAFSPDGARIASGSYDSRIYVSNSYTGDTLPGLFEGHTKSITGILFSPDGARLISCSEDHTIRIWDSFTGVQVRTELRGHQDCVMSIALSSSGELLVSGSDDHTIRVWDLKTGTTVVGPLKGHTDWVDCVALSPDERNIASSSQDCTIRLWSVENGQSSPNSLLGHTDRVRCVAYSPDGKKIVSAGFDKTIRVWSSETGSLVAGPFQGHEGTVYSVLFSSDGTHIISGSIDGTICIWDASHSVAGKSPQLVGHTDGIVPVVISPDGTRMASGSSDHTICVWDTHTGNLILGPLTGHTGLVWSIVYTPDGTCIVSGSADGTIRTWDAHTGTTLASPFAQHTDAVMAVTVSPDGRHVASGSKDESVRIWDLRTDSEGGHYPMLHGDWVRSVEFSPNGLYIASGSSDDTICLWAADTGLLIRKLEQHTNTVTSASFSSDSTKLVSCSWDGMLIVWDVETGAVLTGPWKGHDNVARAVAFSPDGTMIASGSHDRTIRLWDAEKGTMLAAPFRGHAGSVRSVAFTPDGKHIVSGSGDCTFRVWDLEIKGGTQHQPEEIGNWVIDDEGWIRDSESRLVLWVPAYLRRIVPVPPCSLAIYPEGSAQTNLKEIVYGDRWAECYIASSDSSTP